MDKIPDFKELEKELSEYLTRKYGSRIKVVSPYWVARPEQNPKGKRKSGKLSRINFDVKPEELEGYLNEYVVKQELAKSILATKVCTHFNRIRYFLEQGREPEAGVGAIKSNMLLIGPTGVGKTYIIKLIAKKIGVPFVKADATKFSETGYVGGDVEDLVRDLVHEADGDLRTAEYGIIYLDEIDKIASSGNVYGPGRVAHRGPAEPPEAHGRDRGGPQDAPRPRSQVEAAMESASAPGR